jgi:hypothetical protein
MESRICSITLDLDVLMDTDENERDFITPAC